MADDVEMKIDWSVPVMPTHPSQSDPFFASQSPSCRPRKKINIENTPEIVCSLPMMTPRANHSKNPEELDHQMPSNTLLETITIAFDAVSEALQTKQTVVTAIAQALDQAISNFQQSPFENIAQKLASNIADTIRRFARAENLNTTNTSRNKNLQSSFYATTYAGIASKLPPTTLLESSVAPQLRSRNTPRQQTLARAPDNRIFIRLPEGHASRQHHIVVISTASS